MSVTGRASEMRTLEQGCELACGVPGQQHEHPGAIALGGEPLVDHVLRRVRIRCQDGEWGARPAIEHGNGRLVGVEQGEARLLGIGMNLRGQQGKILPAIYRRKHRE